MSPRGAAVRAGLWGRVQASSPSLLAALVLAVGVPVTLVAWRFGVAAEEARAAQALQQRAEAVTEVVDTQLQRYQDLAVAAAGFAAESPDVSRAAFERYVDRLQLATAYPGAVGLGLVVPAAEADLPALRARIEAPDARAWAGGGTPGAGDHLVTTAFHRTDGTPATLGSDVGALPEAAAALRRARTEGTPALSDAFVLSRDTQLPSEQRQLSFALAAPVYDGTVLATPAQRMLRLRGWVVLTFRGGNFLGEALRAQGRALDVRLLDQRAAGSARVVALLSDGQLQPDPGAQPEPEDGDVRSLDVLGRTWTVVTSPRAEFAAEAHASTPLIALVGGALATLLLAGLVHTLASSRRRALQAVELTTASLQGAKADLEQTNRELRARNREARALSAFQRDFVASASHELRTPLTSIQGYLELVLEGTEDLGADTRMLLGTVQRNAQRLLALVNDLLTVNNVETNRLALSRAPVRVEDLLADVRELFAQLRPPDLTLVVDVQEGLPMIWADASRIEQVLTNLLGNAVKFTAPGGTVRVSAAADGPAVVIAVADTGIGIPAEDLPRVFERFYRSANAVTDAVPGTGLGLPIAKAIVEAHKGTLDVHSVMGEGTTFTITLPVLEEEQWLASSSSMTNLTS